MKVWILFLILSLAVAYTEVDIKTLYRNNYCPRANDLLHGKYNLTDGLKGLEVKALLDKKIDSVYFQIDAVTGQPNGGLIYLIEKEIARRGQFQWKYTVATLPVQKRGTIPYFKYVLEKTDIIGVYNSDSVQRRAAGAGFSQSIVDASLVLVTVEESVVQHSIWNFLQPFTLMVWISIMASVLFQGFMAAFLERLEKGEDPLSDLYKLTASSLDISYHAWGSYIGAGTITHEKTSTKILNVGYMVVVFVLVSSYTANMAYFLLAQAKQKIGVSSIEEAVQKHASICVISGSNAQLQLQTYYPAVKVITFPEITSAASTYLQYQKLREGACDAAVSAMIDWQTNSILRKSNPECNLVAKDVFRPFYGSIAYKTDFAQNCTSFIESVISAIIIEMKADGTLDSLVENFLQTSWKDLTCSLVSKATTQQKLEMQDVIGIFLLYGIFVGIAIIAAIRKYNIKISGKQVTFSHSGEKEVPVKSSEPVASIDDDDSDESLNEELRHLKLSKLIKVSQLLAQKIDRAIAFQEQGESKPFGLRIDPNVTESQYLSEQHSYSPYNEAFVDTAKYFHRTSKIARELSNRSEYSPRTEDSSSCDALTNPAQSLDAWMGTEI